uniref:Uncharacterized protein n=1 Tax=Rhizophora mucronata TaxID=61149 RepID=A0A2P2R240_RHIMU
MLDLNDLLIS